MHASDILGFTASTLLQCTNLKERLAGQNTPIIHLHPRLECKAPVDALGPLAERTAAHDADQRLDIRMLPKDIDFADHQVVLEDQQLAILVPDRVPLWSAWVGADRPVRVREGDDGAGEELAVKFETGFDPCRRAELEEEGGLVAAVVSQGWGTWGMLDAGSLLVISFDTLRHWRRR